LIDSGSWWIQELGGGEEEKRGNQKSPGKHQSQQELMYYSFSMIAFVFLIGANYGCWIVLEQKPSSTTLIIGGAFQDQTLAT